jgi:hypothetical protein
MPASTVAEIATGDTATLAPLSVTLAVIGDPETLAVIGDPETLAVMLTASPPVRPTARCE